MVAIADVQAFLDETFPLSPNIVEAVGDRQARIRHPVDHTHLRPGGTVSGPTMMALADSSAYVAIFSEFGILPMAVTTSLNINFLNRPAAGVDLIAAAELLKVGRRLVVVDVRIYSDGNAAVVAQASVTYSIPPRSQA